MRIYRQFSARLADLGQVSRVLNGHVLRKIIQADSRNIPQFEMREVIDKISVLCISLLPQIAPSYEPEDLLNTKHRTSYMDGLRGVAALIVFIQHWVLYQFPDLRAGYSTDKNNILLFQLPFFRIITAGSGAVSIFFVISGFVLSSSSIKSIHHQDFAALQKTIASSSYRRIVRLYLPVLPSTLLAGIWSFAGSPYPENARQATLVGQIVSWWKTLLITIDPFQNLNIRNPSGPPYAGQLWTLPFEYRGSMVVFLIILATSRLRCWVRVCIVILFALYALCSYYWDIYLFLSGVLIAETHFIINENHLSENVPPCFDGRDFADTGPCHDCKTPRSCWKHVLRLLGQVAFVLGAAACVHILAFPILDQENAFGYRTLVSFTPQLYASQPSMGIGTGTERFWLSLSAVIFVTLVSLSDILQRPFRTRLAQALGDISYSLYIIHVPLIYTLGRWLLERDWDSRGGVGVAFILSSLVVVPVVLWASVVYSRLVDMKSVIFSKWLYEKLCN